MVTVGGWVESKNVLWLCHLSCATLFSRLAGLVLSLFYHAYGRPKDGYKETACVTANGTRCLHINNPLGARILPVEPFIYVYLWHPSSLWKLYNSTSWPVGIFPGESNTTHPLMSQLCVWLVIVQPIGCRRDHVSCYLGASASIADVVTWTWIRV